LFEKFRNQIMGYESFVPWCDDRSVLDRTYVPYVFEYRNPLLSTATHFSISMFNPSPIESAIKKIYMW
jgi:hypothetical protein